MAEGVAESIPVPEETEAQKLQRQRMEREDTSKIAGDDIWNIMYYAGVVLLGIIVMMVINSEGFQFLMNALGKMVGAAASVMDFIGKNPWLLFLLPLIAPLFRFLTTMGSRFGSPEGKKQAGLIDKLFTDAKFKGRNVGFSARVRAEYANFTPDQKAYLNGKLEQMKTPIDSQSLAADIETQMPGATVEAKANAYSQQMVVMKKNQANMVFSDLVATMGPDNPRSGPSNLLIEGTINSAQNAGDMLRSGKPVSKVDVQNVFMAVAALKKAESALRASYKDGFNELKADIESTGHTMESEMKLRERIAVLNNTDAITDPGGKKPNMKIDPDVVLKIAHGKAMAELTKNGNSLVNVSQAKINYAVKKQIDNAYEAFDPDNAKSRANVGAKLTDPTNKKSTAVLSFKPPKEYGDALKKKSYWSNPKTANSFGDVPSFKAPNLKFKIP